jgi:hypothetical protein
MFLINVESVTDIVYCEDKYLMVFSHKCLYGSFVMCLSFIVVQEVDRLQRLVEPEGGEGEMKLKNSV